MSNSSNQSGGAGCLTLFLLLFVTLKLCGVINWSWWLVLTPLWLSLAILLLVVVLYAIAGYARHKADR